MAQVTQQQMLDAGVHFGHLKRKWHPKMAPYIFMEKNDIHLIDLNQTQAKLEEASNAIRSIVRSGRKVLFVATKKQAKEIIESEAQRLNMPYVTERWLGGMLTNFATVRKSIKKMSNIDKMAQNGTMATLSKKERLMISREKEKLQRVLGGIEDLNRLPAALFIVDIKNEHIAVKEAQKLNIPTFAMVDTNSDPTQVDFPIPSNDDATKSIALITRAIMEAVEKGMQERKYDKDSAEVSSDEGVAAEAAESVAAEGGKEEAAVAAAPAAELAEDAGEIADSASDVTESNEEA
ncbi:MAG: 30S ribosomal protein S2 [Sphingomonadales bacterium]|nr:30S ribosomal protein S2 [Sphingomonadales bacterium]